MRSGRQRSWRRGFTLVETLAAVAIVIILLGVSAVGVTYYARWLKIAELDNAAREIYLAAENRAVLLSGSDRLEKLVSDPGRSVIVTLESGPDSTAQGYYIHHTGVSGAADHLLPLGAIDPALMDGTFYIVYEPKGGSVTDVFYAESEPKADGVDFQTFYQKVSTSPRSDRMQMKPMVGYYGGGTAENARDGALDVPTVTIRNEETLTAEITYTALPSMADKNMALDVKLSYNDCEVNISGDATLLSQTETYGRTRFTYTVTLDSLAPGELHFWERFKNVSGGPDSFGGDFTVTATLAVKDGAVSGSGSGKGNSLFAEGSNNETAYIANLRHLQNLDSASKVDGKTKAVQKDHIDCASYLGKSYTFKPIENDELKSYDGGSFTLRGLQAKGASAGLFADVAGTGPEPENLWKFQNIRMVNASAEGTDYAGALVGYAQNAEFKNCWVYWEPETGSLRNKLVDAGKYKYQITGPSAGGLAGRMTGGRVENCLAATLVDGTDAAGGLAGQTTGAVIITNSYADCYLTGGAKVGGLVGTAETLALTNCFAAGFIDIPAVTDPAGNPVASSVSAAGLCVDGTVTGTSVYSAMRYSDTVPEANLLPLAPGAPPDPDALNPAWQNFFYLSLEFGAGKGHKKTYTEMTDSAFAGTLGTAFKTKLPKDSHPYNLREGLALTVYDFPGLANLPQYGDWIAQFVEASLVYYEQYDANNTVKSYGFYGGGVDALQDRQPMKDGYAIAFTGNELWINIAGEGYEKYSGTGTPEKLHRIMIGTTIYRFVPLPDELVIGGAVSKDFYQPLRFAVEKVVYGPDGEDVVPAPDSGETHTYYYCPHFAKTAVKIDKPPSAPSAVSVRTPRHLYMLSEHEEYYHGGYSFYQELDLDYGKDAVYSGYGMFPEGSSGKSFPADFTQASIGFDKPFNGLYDGGCHVIKNLRFEPNAAAAPVYAGLFGYSSGTLRNIVYIMDAGQKTVSVDHQHALYFGGLAGCNAGSIVNCAVEGVSLTDSAYGGARLYLGGLAGLNQGEISNCAAECAALTANAANFGHAWVGGLVGQNWNSGLISSSYAVGRASADADDSSNAWVCGFAGDNQGLVQYSYAAMDLSSSGKAVQTFGFCGEGGTRHDTFFLNKGNFTYRDVSYGAGYEGAEPRTYGELTDRESDPAPVRGMLFVAPGDSGSPDEPAVFPYPTAVHNAAGQPVHHGQWPKPMDLGVMGVYYWEKLEIKGETPTYHLSLLSADPSEKAVTKQSTLSEAHSDNGVVTDYGYGYYGAEGATVALTAEDLRWSTNGVTAEFVAAEDKEATDANKALAALMPGYTFHSYRSYGMESENSGLYPAAKYTDPSHATQAMKISGTNNTEIHIKDYTRKPNGTFKLKQGINQVVFIINPHFADALAVKLLPEGASDDPGFTAYLDYTDEGYALAGGASADAPGSTENNPYQVRALSQLQNINWCMRSNGGSEDGENGISNSTVINNAPNGYYAGNQYGFLYLSHDGRHGPDFGSSHTGPKDGVDEGDYNYSWSELYEYHWEQTHDIDGKESDFSPIAAFQDRTDGGTNASGNAGTVILTAWFGGSYDGGDYTIKNINIAAADTNCVGLFGVTLDATLKNIVLYSERGNNTVTVTGRDSYGYGYYPWYAAGGLVGLAGKSEENASAEKTISNCSVSGYRIVDKTKYGNALASGAAAVGGLVGVCNLNLHNCTATTTIEMSYTRNPPSAAGSHMRVGGLAGTCVASIENCYAGGEIKKLNNVTSGRIFLGGLVGGAGMRDMYVPYFSVSVSGGTVEIRDSYSTVQMPEKNIPDNDSDWWKHGCIGDSQAIGGTGGNDSYTVTIDNCYAMYGDTEGDTRGKLVSYAELAGEGMYDLLEDFRPVTAQTDDGFSVSGKYSYASAPSLQGLNYPFPTILTRNNGLYHVHYGNWPVNGISRDTGSAPIELDLFTAPVHTETLKLEGGASGGTWAAVAAPVETGETDEAGAPVTKEIVEADITSDGVLTVKGKGVGVTTLTVSCTAGGVTHTLELEVGVTADLELGTKDNPVPLFTGDEVSIRLLAFGKDRQELTAPPEGLEVTKPVVDRYDHAHLRMPKLDEDLTLKLTSLGEGDATVNLGYTYSYEGVSYTGMSAVTFQVKKPAIEDEGTKRRVCFDVFENKENATIRDISAVVTSGNLTGDKLTIDREGHKVDLDMAGVPAGKAVTVKVTLTMNDRQHVVTVTVAKEPDGGQTE